MWNELIEFAWIVAPAVVVHPVSKWISSMWRFAWRMALVRSYLSHYDVTNPAVEGAAQRIQEVQQLPKSNPFSPFATLMNLRPHILSLSCEQDTQRFESSIFSCVTIVLDSVLTLVIFIPVLIDVGAKAHPPDWDWPPWLVSIAIQAALGGLLVSVFVGRKLVVLEVENQKAEAAFRTKLVMLEQSPASVVGVEPFPINPYEDVPCNDYTDIQVGTPTPRPVAPIFSFTLQVGALWKNYRRLFEQFFYFNCWINTYDQFMVLLPYMLIAPLMFAENPEVQQLPQSTPFSPFPTLLNLGNFPNLDLLTLFPRLSLSCEQDRITLGSLMKVTNAFDKVFSAMAVVTESWPAINDFRSTLWRLREFEQAVYTRKRFDHSLLREASILPGEVPLAELAELPATSTTSVRIADAL